MATKFFSQFNVFFAHSTQFNHLLTKSLEPWQLVTVTVTVTVTVIFVMTHLELLVFLTTRFP